METQLTKEELWDAVQPILETWSIKELTQFRNKHKIFKGCNAN